MIEAEWLSSDDPVALLDYARTRERRKRKDTFLGVACCRRIEHLLTDPRSQAGLEALAELANGAVYDNYRLAVLVAVGSVSAEFQAQWHVTRESTMALELRARWNANDALGQLTDSIKPYFAENVPKFFRTLARAEAYGAGETHWREPGPSWAAALVREIYGNPFRPVKPRPAVLTWQDATVPALAQAIYTEQAWERMPILADALEEAGCIDEDLLYHCRGWERCPTGHLRWPGIAPATVSDGSDWIPLRAPHVPGCWVVDLLLGKA